MIGNILNRLPYLAAKQRLALPGGEFVDFLGYQIVVWVCVTHINDEFDPAVHPRFPAVLDTGTNRGFYLKESHLREWAGIDDPLTPAPSAGGLLMWHPHEEPVPPWRMHRHRVLLFANQPGTTLVDETALPFDLQVEPVFLPSRPFHKLKNKRNAPPGPRVPVLGLPAFERRRLYLHIDCGARTVTLRE